MTNNQELLDEMADIERQKGRILLSKDLGRVIRAELAKAQGKDYNKLWAWFSRRKADGTLHSKD